MLWEHESQTSVSTAFRVLPNFHEQKQEKQLVYFDYRTINSLCSRHHCVNSSCYFCVMETRFLTNQTVFENAIEVENLWKKEQKMRQKDSGNQEPLLFIVQSCLVLFYWINKNCIERYEWHNAKLNQNVQKVTKYSTSWKRRKKNLNLLEIFSKHFEVQMSKTCLTSKSYA